LASVSVGDFCHSYQPSAGTRQRRDFAARLKAGFSRTESARELIIRLPILTSLAQLGTRPQFTMRSCRTGAASSAEPRGGRDMTTGAFLVGATL
jgi:hypothetical protein